MDTAIRNELLTCRVGLGPDPSRVGLVLDYRGDHPPIGLFALLREHGWKTPAPHAPPAAAIDWDHPDPVTGRRWSLRPFWVTGALAVPGGETPPEAASPEGVRTLLDRVGVVPEVEPVSVGSLREIQPGLAEVLTPEEVAGLAPVALDDPALTVTAALPAPPDPAEAAAPVATADAAAPVAADPVVVAEPVSVSSPSPDVVERLVAHDPAPVLDGPGAPLAWSPPDPAMCTRTIWAVVRRGAVGRVVDLLHERGLEDRAMFLPVAGEGRGGGRVTRYRGRERIEPLQRIQVQVAVDPDDVDDLVAALIDAGRSGEKGDGKIWVT